MDCVLDFISTYIMPLFPIPLEVEKIGQIEEISCVKAAKKASLSTWSTGTL